MDTSIFIAAEHGRGSDEPCSGEARISVATLTELSVGVLRANRRALLPLREATLARAQSFVALPYDELVAERLASLVSVARDAGKRVGLMDAIIAATALVHGLAVWTHDEDFRVLAEVAPELQVARA